MKCLKEQISDLLQDIEKMIKNREKQEFENKRKELDNLLNEYLKNFKYNIQIYIIYTIRKI